MAQLDGNDPYIDNLEALGYEKWVFVECLTEDGVQAVGEEDVEVVVEERVQAVYSRRWCSSYSRRGFFVKFILQFSWSIFNFLLIIILYIL